MWTCWADRRVTPELMDQPDLAPPRHRAALRGLARLHGLTRITRDIGDALVELAAEHASAHGDGRPLRVRDVATGDGALPRAVARRFAAEGLAIEIEATDLSDEAIAAASDAAAADASTEAERAIRFRVHDALAGPALGEVDVLTCSLFLHHLETEEAAALLGRFAAEAKRAVIVHDLYRDRVGFAVVWAGSRLVTRSDVVHVDALRSVRAGWMPGELLSLAEEAGLGVGRVDSRWPTRFLIRWTR